MPDTGIVGVDKLQLNQNAFAIKDTKELKRAWHADQKYKLTMRGSDELVLPISERRFEPLDPLRRRGKAEDEQSIAITEVAIDNRRAAFSRVMDENKKGPNALLLQTMLWLCGIVASIAVLAVMVKGCGK